MSMTAPARMALQPSWLFDGVAQTLLADPVVLVEGDRVVDVVRGGPLPDGYAEVALPGATLLPGLVDTHVHLAFDSSVDPVGALAARDDAAAIVAMVAAGQAALRGGVTTVRDLGDRDYLSLELRGRVDLPTLLCAGPPVTKVDGHCHYLGGCIEPTVPAGRAAVRERAERGVDVVKVMASGGTLTPTTYQHEVALPADVLAAIVDEAHRHRLPVTAHAHATGAIADALAAGIDGMEHVSFWTEDSVDAPEQLLRAVAERGIVVGATMGLAPVEGNLQGPPAVMARIPLIIANLRRMLELGAVVVAGTDAGIGPPKPPDVVRHVPAMASMIGLGPAAALRMITSTAAGVLGLGSTKGRVAAGYDADLLAVDGDPLSDLEALHRIRGVWARGVRIVPNGG